MPNEGTVTPLMNSLNLLYEDSQARVVRFVGGKHVVDGRPQQTM